MLPFRESRIAKVLTIVFFLIVAGYAYYEIRGMLFGPRIHIPSTVTETSERFVILKGKADRIATLSMNGKAITVTEEGVFEEPYLLSEGLNRIVFDAEDKYGRSQSEVMQIVYIPSPTPEAPSAEQASSTDPDIAPQAL